jgi:hypothetical protein
VVFWETNRNFEGEIMMAEKIYGLLILPYQYMQMIGYRLSGIPCRYEFGVFGVKPLTPTTRSQRLVSKLLPLVTLGIGWIMQIGIAVYLARLYQTTLPLVPFLFMLLSTPPLALYTHYVRFDLRQKKPLVSQPHSSQQGQN